VTDQQPPQQQPPPPPDQQTPPPQQPQWSPPPQQPSGWGGAGAAPAERPMGVTLGAIYLIVMGALATLGGACVALAGGMLGGVGVDDPTGLFGMLAGLALIGGIIVVVVGVLHIVAGAGALGGRSWARWLGIVVSIVMAILLGLSALGSLGQDVGGAVVSLVLAALFAATAWAFLQATTWFSYRR
jgi:hypothetical protein